MAAKRMNRHLTKKQLKELNEIVLAEKERIETKLAVEEHHKQIAETNSGRDEVDSANDDILKRTELRFTTRETLYLKKINKTLGIMEGDEYGMCEDCGAQITFQRLKARPTSTMCITCKEESEREEFQNFHGRVSKSLGQQVNLSTKI